MGHAIMTLVPVGLVSKNWVISREYIRHSLVPRVIKVAVAVAAVLVAVAVVVVLIVVVVLPGDCWFVCLSNIITLTKD